MTIQEMVERKRELGFTNEQISALSGVPLGTVMKIFGGATKNPRRETRLALERALTQNTSGYYSDLFHSSQDRGYPKGAMLRESSFAYASHESGKEDISESLAGHTVDDYYAMPDDQRMELIDGVFYDMGAPRVIHQIVIGELYLQLKLCEKAHGGECRVLLSPCDVQLDCDQSTMVQPDLLVVCDRSRIREKVCWGAPDLVIEVLSPSSRSHDCVLKLRKYKNAGVREYWIVDPEHLLVIVYEFEPEERIRIYTFDDTVPVGISGGKCSVDFAEIRKEVKDLI